MPRAAAKERAIEKAAIKFVPYLHDFIQSGDSKQSRETLRAVIFREFTKFTHKEMIDIFWIAYRLYPHYYRNVRTWTPEQLEQENIIADILGS